MREKSNLDDLLSQGKFAEASSLLKYQLTVAEIIDPSDDKTWAQYADKISFKILSDVGQEAFIAYWQDLLRFFEEDLEPAWNHLHKGHILFRLGFARLSDDIPAGRKYLENALDEDRLLEKKRGREDTDVEKAITGYSSYVTLCIIERIEDEHFDSEIEKQKFFRDLFSKSFDAAIFGQSVNQASVEKAVKGIVPQQAIEQVFDIKNELDLASKLGQRIATVSLAGAFLESVLLSILYYKDAVRTVQGKDVLRIELGPLLEEATKKNVFPSDAIRAACQVIHIFRNRLHPGNELLQKYALTKRVASTLKILLDLVLVEWGS